jgi:hypothetical protein
VAAEWQRESARRERKVAHAKAMVLFGVHDAEAGEEASSIAGHRREDRLQPRD